MANARTRFDTIREYMTRSHDTTSGLLYGKPCSMFRGRAFIAFHLEGMAFKMRGRMRLQALAMADSRFWDPLLPDRPDPEWVWVPSQHVLRWDRFAVEAYRQQKEQGDMAMARTTRPSGPVAAPISARPVAVETGSLQMLELAETTATDAVSDDRIGSTPMPAASGQTTVRPAPNWGERLKRLSFWSKWTTSRLDE
jgi:hypothetical protein